MNGSRDLVVVLLPVFNDWSALGRLLPRLVSALRTQRRPFAILIVDDGSTEAPISALEIPNDVAWMRVLRLRRNLGHQRAIAAGLCYIHDNIVCSDVVVMDADGEDLPEDVPRLLERRQGNSCVVFAERRRRAEGWVFKLFYLLYRLIHVALTGQSVRVGNFSVISRERLGSLVVVAELWIHYAASVFRSRQPLALVPTARGRRLDGRSKMSFVSLVVHGLSAISVYSDVVFTRLVVAVSGLVVMSILLAGTAIGLRLFTDLAIPGWATYVVGLVLIVLLQAVMFAVALTFQVLGARSLSTVLPQRDYANFVDSVVELERQPEIVRA